MSIPSDNFDLTDPKNIGRPIYFQMERYIETVKMLIRSDELQLAIHMIDNPPAWWREHKSPELESIRHALYRQMYDIFLYGNDDDEASQTLETCVEQWRGAYCYPRAELITQAIKRLNEEGKRPWIFDLSCSHGNLPIGLKHEGARFTYLGKSMNHRAAQKVKQWMGELWADEPKDDQPCVLISTEALEHAHDPLDIVRAAYKVRSQWDEIFFSTPLGCLGGGLPDWETRPLGHVRGWTPAEFSEWAAKHWPGYNWTLYRSHSMVLHGKR